MLKKSKNISEVVKLIVKLDLSKTVNGFVYTVLAHTGIENIGQIIFENMKHVAIALF